MKSWTKPTPEDIKKALRSVDKATDRQFFYAGLKNPLWIKPLADEGCFKAPPDVINLPEGMIQYPFWPELQYLSNMSEDAPDEVIDLVLHFPKTNNPIVYKEILNIALKLQGTKSAALLPKVLECADMDSQIVDFKFPKLLTHWTKENQTSAALKLAEKLVRFSADPQSQEKQNRRKKNPEDHWSTSLKPAPKFKRGAYQKILNDGLRTLAESKPYDLACILIDATENMIYPSNASDYARRK